MSIIGVTSRGHRAYTFSVRVAAYSLKALSHKAFRAVFYFTNTLLAIAATGVMAQSFPNRPLKMIVPLAAAGTGDTLARAVGEGMAKELGQAVVVENRPGAQRCDLRPGATRDGWLAAVATVHRERPPEADGDHQQQTRAQ